MPAARDAASFRRALASVLAQDFEDLDVIVSDDSGGGLRAAVEAAGDPRVRYYPNPERLGFARNHTTSLDRATGRLIAFLHDDDWWAPDYLATAVGVLDRDPELGLVCTDVWLADDGRLRRRANRPPPGRHDRWLHLVMRHPHFQPTSTVLRREVWERGRRVWPDVGIGDLVLWIDAARAGWPMYWVDVPLTYYHQHGGQIIAGDELRFAAVAVLSEYRFDEDPEAEAGRRWRLARAHVGCAGADLRAGRIQTARAHLEAAAEADASASRVRRIAFRVAASNPHLLPVARSAWRLLRRRPT
jgi:glycosyltransferase involved in cell wall biosynthesis